MKPQWGSVLVSALVLSVTACTPPTPKPSLSSPPWANRPECPVDSAVAWVWDKGQEMWVPINEIPLSGPISKIPEYNDCQRFIVPGDTYGALYAVYASFRLTALALRADSLKDTTYSHGRTAVPAATIYSYGGTYPALGIEPGFNCLYLSNPPDWHARMVPMGFVEPNCLDPINPSATSGTDLQVKHMTVDAVTDDRAYPPVARWDWDPKNGIQYVGIKCGAQWCEVGSNGFVPTPFYTAPPLLELDGVASTDPAVNVVSHIKGWNDAQFLDSVADGKQVPTGIWGTIIPHPMNDRTFNASTYQNGWINVADAVIHGGKYKKRNFTEGVNKIYFCHGQGVATSSTEPGCKGASSVSCAPDPTDGRLWYAMIVSAASDTAYRCVIRRVHAGTAVPYIPGAARWRWENNDVTNWIKCPSGCCQIE